MRFKDQRFTATENNEMMSETMGKIINQTSLLNGIENDMFNDEVYRVFMNEAFSDNSEDGHDQLSNNNKNDKKKNDKKKTKKKKKRTRR